MATVFQSLRRITLTKWILIAMVIGVLVGWWFPDIGVQLKPLSTLFLRMIKSIIVPIIFGTLVVGIALYFVYGYRHSTLRRGQKAE